MMVPQTTRGPLVLFAHPNGVRERVRRLARQEHGALTIPARILVIGSSTGLGLAARVLAVAGGAATVGVCHSRPGTPGRTGSAGWYATAEVHALAERGGLSCWTVLGDAFADRTRAETVRTVARTMGQVDLVVYSIAAARRRDPATGRLHRSAIRTIGRPRTDKTLDPATGVVHPATLRAASPEEVADTVAVMGGADWELWWQALDRGGVLAPDATTVAFSYLGGSRLRPTYRGGTLGAAKDHLEATARSMGGPGRRARVVVTSAHVTQSSAMIPMTPLYWTLLDRILRERGPGEQGLMEGPSEQLARLFAGVLAQDRVDGAGRLRLDDRECDPEVQRELERRWELATTSSLPALGDPGAYRRELLLGSGFGVAGVDPTAEVDPVVPIDHLVQS